ncbi:MAG: universal stress protein [Gemmatimonadales bacterium]
MTAVEMITRELDQNTTFAPKSKGRSIVVATDGTDSALAALNAALLIVSGDEADVHVLSVVEPIPVAFPTPDGMLLPLDFESSRQDAQRAIVEAQVRQLDSTWQWAVNVKPGRPADVIVAFAQEKEAELIIMGANKHGVWGRLFGEETAMEIARLSDIPLLVASPHMKRLPKRVLVAMDLKADGLQSAPKALAAIVDTRSISCVHAKPKSEFIGVDWAEFDSGYDNAMRDRFSTFEKAFNAVHLRPDLVILHGDPAHEVTDFAEFSKAELIVVGVKRRRGRARAVGGRMASRVIRRANCSVLIVPNLITEKTVAPLPRDTTDVIRDSRLWSSALRDFNARNAGRIVNLEVDDPEIGALVEASRYPLLGVDFDHKDKRLTISLGDTHGTERHLTRTVSRPEAVSILSIDDRDTALSITHGGGQTLLTF